MYMALKHIHMLCALLSLMGFLIRTTWAFQGSSLLTRKPVKIAPHIIDTVFLLSAIGLVLTLKQYPFIHTWVSAKFFGLITYIVLGTLTLKRARNNQQRAVFFALSIATYAYIVMVARTKDALFFL